MYRITFELAGLPRMANGSHGHWSTAANERKKWRTYVAGAILRSGRPPKPLERVRLTLIRFSAVEPDFDGLVRGFKSVVDGLVEAGVIKDDKMSITGPWSCFWEKASPKKGRVVVVVEEVSERPEFCEGPPA